MKLIKLLTSKKLIISLLLTGLLISPLAFSVKADNLFAGGDFMTAVNNTQRTSGWADPVSANPGEIIEYRIVAQNVQTGTVAHDVTFHVNFPTSPSNSPQVQSVVSANGTSVSDGATVNVSGTAGYLLVYETGHTRVFSPGCPSGCNADDSFRDGGNINVGDLAYGESAQVLFKAGLTNPAPACTSDGSCDAAAPACGTTTTGVDNCGTACTKKGDDCVVACVSNDSCSVSTPTACGQTNTGVDNCDRACSRSSAACDQGQTQSQSQSQTVNITNPTPAAAPATPVVATLPKTGLPAIAWLVSALVPTGFGLRRFRGIKKELEDDPNYIWEDRKFKSSI